MDRLDFLKSLPGIAALPCMASQVIDLDKPKLLILTSEDYLSQQQIHIIQESVKHNLPGWKVIVVNGGLKCEVREL